MTNNKNIEQSHMPSIYVEYSSKRVRIHDDIFHVDFWYYHFMNNNSLNL